MPAASSGMTEGLTITSGVLVLAIVFAWRQWVERRDRVPDLSDDDQRYFSSRDVRRSWGTGLLVLIAAGMFLGLSINPKANRAAGQQFVWVWVGVLVLLCVALVMALLDWQANLTYARRHRREILEARRALIEEEQRLRASTYQGEESRSNGRHHPQE